MLTEELIVYFLNNTFPVLDYDFVELIRQNGGVYFDHLVYKWGQHTCFMAKLMALDKCYEPIYYSIFVKNSTSWELSDSFISSDKNKYDSYPYYYNVNTLQCKVSEIFLNEYRQSKYNRMNFLRMLSNNNILGRLPLLVQLMIEEFVIPLTKKCFKPLKVIVDLNNLSVKK